MAHSRNVATYPFAALGLSPLCETSPLAVQCAQLWDILSALLKSAHTHSTRGSQHFDRLTGLQYKLSLPLSIAFDLIKLALDEAEVELHLPADFCRIGLASKVRQV